MKIAIFVDLFPVRSQTFVLNQITGLIDLGVDIQIIALRKGDCLLFEQGDFLKYELEKHCIYLMEEQSGNIKKLFSRVGKIVCSLFKFPLSIKVLRGLNPAFGVQALNLMLSTIATNQTKALEFDWIVCHFGPNGVLASKLRKMKVISGKIATIFHGVDMSVSQHIVGSLNDYQRLYNDSELLLPISELWGRKLVELGANPDKIKVHRMGVDLTHFKYKPKFKEAEHQVDKSKPFILYTVARFTEKKGLKYAIESITYLPDNLNVNFKIAGYGKLEQELRSLVKALNISHKVSFVGPVNAEEVKSHMISADVFLQPSVTALNGDMEGVPVSIMEAMAVGTPVIATYHSGIPELIENEKHGLLVCERDSQAIADRILYLYENESYCQKLVNDARKRVEKIADVEKLNMQLLNVLKACYENS